MCLFESQVPRVDTPTLSQPLSVCLSVKDPENTPPPVIIISLSVCLSVKSRPSPHFVCVSACVISQFKTPPPTYPPSQSLSVCLSVYVYVGLSVHLSVKHPMGKKNSTIFSVLILHHFYTIHVILTPNLKKHLNSTTLQLPPQKKKVLIFITQGVPACLFD